MAFVGLFSIVGFLACLVLLILNAIKKKNKRNSILGLIICFAPFIVACAMTPPSDTTYSEPQESTPEPTVSKDTVPPSDTTSDKPKEPTPKPIISEKPTDGNALNIPAKTPITPDTLWSKITGVWYDPQITDYLELFVVDYNEESQPVIYNVWGFDKSEDAVATGISDMGNSQYEVTFEESSGTWKRIFDCSESGKLTVSDSDYSFSQHYDFLSFTLEEAYDTYDMYAGSSDENNEKTTTSTGILTVYEAKEILRNKMSDEFNGYPRTIEYLGEYSLTKRNDSYKFLISITRPYDGFVIEYRYAVLKTRGLIVSL